MKKFFLTAILIIALVSGFTSCKKNNSTDPDTPQPQKEALFDAMCRMYNGTSENAIQIAKEQGFMYIDYDSTMCVYSCYKDTNVAITDTIDIINIYTNDSNKVTSIELTQSRTGNKLVEMASIQMKEIGEQHTLGNSTCVFECGCCDSDADIEVYNDFIITIQNATFEILAGWSTNNIGEGFSLMVNYDNENDITGLSLLIGIIVE